MITAKKYYLFSLVLLLSLILFRYSSAGEQSNRQLEIAADTVKKEGKTVISPVKAQQVIALSEAESLSQQDADSKETKITPAGAQPHIIITHPEYDAGAVWQGEDIIHDFIIKNTGTAELNIKDVKAG